MTHAISENFKRVRGGEPPPPLLLTLPLGPSPYRLADASTQRENANALLSQLYSSCTAVYWAHTDWPDVVMGSASDNENIAATLHDFLGSVRLLMREDTRDETYEAAYRRCMTGLRTINYLNDVLGVKLGFTKGGEGGISRLYQYTRYLVANIQDLRNSAYLLRLAPPTMLTHPLHQCGSTVEHPTACASSARS